MWDRYCRGRLSVRRRGGGVAAGRCGRQGMHECMPFGLLQVRHCVRRARLPGKCHLQQGMSTEAGRLPQEVRGGHSGRRAGGQHRDVLLVSRFSVRDPVREVLHRVLFVSEERVVQVWRMQRHLRGRELVLVPLVHRSESESSGSEEVTEQWASRARRNDFIFRCGRASSAGLVAWCAAGPQGLPAGTGR